jgi:hypothetical protein
VNERSPILSLQEIISVNNAIMDKKGYLRILNEELQKLNGIIDYKIINDHDYQSDARRHKKLLQQIRREEAGKMLSRSFHLLIPRWR